MILYPIKTDTNIIIPIVLNRINNYFHITSYFIFFLFCIFLIPPSFAGETEDKGLRQAAFNGDLAMVNVYLGIGADINGQDKTGISAMLAAANQGHVEIISALIDKGANINIQEGNGITPLYRAASQGHHEVVKLLLDNDADYKIPDKFGGTALGASTRYGHKEVVKTLLEHGVSVDDEIDTRGNTALLMAAFTGNADLVQLLLDNGADVYRKNNAGANAHDIATSKGFLGVDRNLLTHIVKIKKRKQDKDKEHNPEDIKKIRDYSRILKPDVIRTTQPTLIKESYDKTIKLLIKMEEYDEARKYINLYIAYVRNQKDYKLELEIIDQIFDFADLTNESRDRSSAHSARSGMLERTKKYDEAIADLIKALEFDNMEDQGFHRANMLARLVKLYTIVGNVEGMRKTHEKQLNVFNEHTDETLLVPSVGDFDQYLFFLYLKRADMELQLGEFDEARKVVKLAGKISRNHKNISVKFDQSMAIQVMLSKIDHKSEDETIKYINHEHMYHLHLDGFTANMNNEYEYKGVNYRNYLVHPNVYNRHYEQLGDIEVENGHFDVAQKVYERLFINLIEAYEFEINAQKTIDIYAKIAASRVANIHIKLGDVLAENDDPHIAKEHYKAALALYEKYDYSDKAEEIRERSF
ncbi:ankyrin repeat domain-containing protein [Pseudemcibacter aquimaris]|uniref:ankyrin repeat domain-containing protein n=1 Tax=Pseudemcibacter aquimaris TaxID=2857064 RepID=UPI0020112319|nr:ankyrin repeat domain-containing protein [Pseudemcibacter aquimaris]MCC3861105.1 ankyrin repeat domain-containing protein [Pseudemcibacter aquimaris]WDU59923.1 ankyrin repeat domain-containing protein [Pseudemcibacter aquimaris]